MHLYSHNPALFICALATTLGSAFLAEATRASNENSFRIKTALARNLDEKENLDTRSISMIAKGKAAVTKLLKDSTKFESRSTPDHIRYGKLGDWTSAKKDFLDIVEPGSIRTHVNNIRMFGQGIRKKIWMLEGTVGDKKLVLTRGGHNRLPTSLQVIDDDLRSSHIDEFIYTPK